MFDRLKENRHAINDTLKENYDISKVSYDTWIVPMEIHNVDNDQVYILADTKGIPNILDYIKKKYKQILEIVIEEKIGLHCDVFFVNSEELEKRKNLDAEASKIVTNELKCNGIHPVISLQVAPGGRVSGQNIPRSIDSS